MHVGEYVFEFVSVHRLAVTIFYVLRRLVDPLRHEGPSTNSFCSIICSVLDITHPFWSGPKSDARIICSLEWNINLKHWSWTRYGKVETSKKWWSRVSIQGTRKERCWWTGIRHCKQVGRITTGAGTGRHKLECSSVVHYGSIRGKWLKIWGLLKFFQSWSRNRFI